MPWRSGTALIQKRLGGDSITIVTGGDAGTAEGDFASCLIWSTRPGQEVPLLIIVNNNGWGISTPADEVHGEQRIVDLKVKALASPVKSIDGNDPVASWHAPAAAAHRLLPQQARRPCMIEARVSAAVRPLEFQREQPRDRSVTDGPSSCSSTGF